MERTVFPNLTFMYLATATIVYPLGVKKRATYFILHDSGQIEIFTEAATDRLGYLPGKERGDYSIHDLKALASLLYGRPSDEVMDELRSWCKLQPWNPETVVVHEPAPEMTDRDWRRLEKYLME